MAYKPIDDRQVINRSALAVSIGAAANTTLDALFTQIDSVMVNLAGPQKLTNKTIGISNAGLIANTLQFQEIATPSTDPAANTLALYPKSDGNFYSLNSSGIEKEIGASSSLPVGATISAFLTLAQLQSQVGAGFVLSEGQAVPGSAYETLTGGSSVTASATSSVNTTGAIVTFSNLVLSTTGNTNSNNQLTNVSSVAGLAIGQLISATAVPAGTTVASIDQYSFILSGTPDQYTFAVHSSDQYVFTVSSANATAGATYTNNGQTFTVNATIVGATTLDALGTGNPMASGVLTLATGTGDATITFSSFAFAGANATAGAVYTNNTQSFTVSTTITGGVSLTAIGTGDPTASGTLTKTSGTGDTTITFTSFAFGGHNATVGATYTNNGQTFTVLSTIDDDTTLVCTGTGVPTTSGTLTKSSGTGDVTITFTGLAVNLTMSNPATASSPLVVDFSTFVTSTTGNLTMSSAVITNIANSTGIANGQIISVTGITPYATVISLAVTTVPDCRATVLRGKDNGRGLDPNGDLPLGTYEGDSTAVNGLHDTGHTHSFELFGGGGPSNFPLGDVAGGPSGAFSTNAASAALAGDTETRGKSTVINIFIRIN